MEQGSARRPPFSALIDRPSRRWPNGAQLAVLVVPNVEHFRADRGIHGLAEGQGVPGRELGRREYGNRVGIWRLMEILDRHGIRATVALNGEVCIHEARIIEEGHRLGWEWMGHGLTNSVRLTELSATEEREVIRRTSELIKEAVGTPPRGWLSPGLESTDRTAGLLAEAGYDYLCDLVNDDQPYELDTGAPKSILSLPYTLELNDKQVIEAHGRSGVEFAERIWRQFLQLYGEGHASMRVMAIAVHPYISGVPYCASALDEVLARLARFRGVWFATGSEIADAFHESCSTHE